MLSVVLSKDGRARAVQLPAWNEALGLPGPWDQQWSLRLQQIVAYETDLLEFGDIFNGSHEIEARVEELKAEALKELARIDEMGGAVAAIDDGYMKEALVRSNAERIARVASGETVVVGVNKYQDAAPSPLTSQGGGIVTVDEAAEAAQVAGLEAWRANRDAAAVEKALGDLRQAAKSGDNVMPASIEAAKAGATTGEWAEALREVFGEYRAPTGIAGVSAGSATKNYEDMREKVAAVARGRGRPVRILLGKPGLDGHSNGAEQIAVAARDCGMEVVYEGIRLTPEQIANAALEESVDLVGLSVLSGSHMHLGRAVLDEMRKLGLSHVPVVLGGIIPAGDAEALRQLGIRAVYTPKDYEMLAIMDDIVTIVSEGREAA
jgi:(2R)-ethylmalonyl-CoA mutase